MRLIQAIPALPVVDFASQEVAQRWQAARPATLLLPVADAARVAREIAAERVRRAQRL